MRKIPVPRKRNDRDGWWIRWHEGGRKRGMRFETEAEAKRYAKRLFQESRDARFDCIDIDYSEAKEMFLEQVQGKASLIQYRTTFNVLEKTVFNISTVRSIDQFVIDKFSRERKDVASLPKNLKQIKAFLSWLSDRKYAVSDIAWPKIRQKPKRPVKSLDVDNISRLLEHCPSRSWAMRILISVSTGLRPSDIDSLTKSNVDFEDKAFTNGAAQKTGKEFWQPIPDKLIEPLKGYMETLTSDSLFCNRNLRNQWDAICLDAGFIVDGKKTTTRHNFRKTYSTFLQRVGALGHVRDLLQHSNTRITKKHYTTQEMILPALVNKCFNPMLDVWLPIYFSKSDRD